MSQALPEPRHVVLVVDDDEATRLALRDVLAEAGYRVLIVGGGREALDLLRRQRVDVVIIDLMMPEMNGWDLASAIRSDAKLASTPMLVMTAYGAGVLATAPVASGYFSKPIALDPLLGVLRRTLTLRPPPPGGTGSPTFAPVDPMPRRSRRADDPADGADGRPGRQQSGTRPIVGSEDAATIDHVNRSGVRRNR